MMRTGGLSSMVGLMAAGRGDSNWETMVDSWASAVEQEENDQSSTPPSDTLSIQTLLSRCRGSSRKGVATSFFSMVDHMLLFLKSIQYVSAPS